MRCIAKLQETPLTTPSELRGVRLVEYEFSTALSWLAINDERPSLCIYYFLAIDVTVSPYWYQIATYYA